MGRVVADLHRAHGVDLRLDTGVAGITQEGPSGPLQVALTDEQAVEADVVVVGIGVVPNTEWLHGSGLLIEDGVRCDETTLAAPGVVACGDVARWPNPLFDEVMRVEHWEHALDMGAHAARRLLAGDAPGAPFAPVPFFWSDQYDRKVQLAGRVRPTDDIEVVAGSVEDRRFCALYGRDGRVVGALAMNMPARVIRYRRQIADGLHWDDALAAEARTASTAGTASGTPAPIPAARRPPMRPRWPEPRPRSWSRWWTRTGPWWMSWPARRCGRGGSATAAPTSSWSTAVNG
jgi:3-phenylpropionate/trans-cinnamate dioxygenase ferredoxin reductase subunit